MADFEARIREYEKVYQPLTDGKSNRHIHFIQLVNMVTGRGYMDINRISGYLPGKIVFFLMQARPPAAMWDPQSHAACLRVSVATASAPALSRPRTARAR